MLREYARKFPQMGSRDRKEWSMGIYQALRAQRVLRSGDYAPWEQALAAGLLAMHGKDHPWVEFLKRNYTIDNEVLCVMEFKGDEGFPYPDFLSPRVVSDTHAGDFAQGPYGFKRWLQEQGLPGLAWLRIRKGYESVLEDRILRQGWTAPLKFGLEHPSALQAWAMPLGLALNELEGYKEGWFEMQDLSCQRLVECMPTNAAGRWLDACAGSGGKALLLHESHPEIQWFVTDSREPALQELSRRFQRAGWRNYSRGVADWLSPEPVELGSFPSQFDGVLLDAPCSGSGSWRNHPHLQLLGPAMNPVEYAGNQGLMLRRLWSRVLPGGYMLYATCSAYACENEDIVQAFVTEQQEANLLFDRYLNASPQGGDTMYAALVHKTME
jgi:16S rRNA (cytosine967-C5)-methyltransferase